MILLVVGVALEPAEDAGLLLYDVGEDRDVVVGVVLCIIRADMSMDSSSSSSTTSLWMGVARLPLATSSTSSTTPSSLSSVSLEPGPREVTLKKIKKQKRTTHYNTVHVFHKNVHYVE